MPGTKIAESLRREQIIGAAQEQAVVGETPNLAARLQAAGLNATSVQNPLTTLPAAAFARSRSATSRRGPG